MTQFLRTLSTDLKMQSRVPITWFFALIFPVLMLVIFTLSYGNSTMPGTSYRFVDKYILIAIALGTLPTCFISFSAWIGEAVHDGTYKRLALFGVNMKHVFGATLMTHLILIFTTIGINLLTAKLFFEATLPDLSHLLSYLALTLYALLTCIVIGLLTAFLTPNFKSIVPLAMAIMFATYITCGAFIPYEYLPEFLKTLADYVPMKFMIQDFFEIYSGQTYFNARFLPLNTLWLALLSTALFLVYRYRGRKALT